MIEQQLEVISDFMHRIGFGIANGEIWRGFKRGRESISFHVAKNIVEFARPMGSCMASFVDVTPNLVIVKEMTLTGKNKEYRIPKGLWMNACANKKHVYVLSLQVDKRRRVVFNNMANKEMSYRG